MLHLQQKVALSEKFFTELKKILQKYLQMFRFELRYTCTETTRMKG